jgi:nucleoside-diphosphate kinase
MAARDDEAWLFVAEWFDPMPRLKRMYLLKYFVQQHQVEMVDVKSKKMFLKKSACPAEITPEDFAVGKKVRSVFELRDAVAETLHLHFAHSFD